MLFDVDCHVCRDVSNILDRENRTKISTDQSPSLVDRVTDGNGERHPVMEDWELQTEK
jgi:hypothetical protein